MTPIFWSAPMLAAVLVLGIIALRLAARRLRARRAIPAELRAELAAMPMSPMQRRAWIALALVGVVFLMSAAVIASRGGATVYWEADGLRQSITLAFIATMVVHALLIYAPMRSTSSRGRIDGQIDERDRRIFEAAPAYQSVAMLVTMGVWVIYLTESSLPERVIPTAYLYLIMGSLFFAHMAATDLGILFGYWSGVGDVEE